MLADGGGVPLRELAGLYFQPIGHFLNRIRPKPKETGDAEVDDALAAFLKS